MYDVYAMTVYRVSIYDYQAMCDIWSEGSQAASTVYHVSLLLFLCCSKLEPQTTKQLAAIFVNFNKPFRV